MMNPLSVGYAIACIYYGMSISYLYFKLLTPKASLRHSYLLCRLLILSTAIWVCIDSNLMSIGIVTNLLLSLLLFQDSWKRRMSAFVLIYSLQLLVESIATPLAQIPIWLLTGQPMQAQISSQASVTEVTCMVSCIIIAGTAVTLLIAPVMASWFRLYRTRTLILIGLPIFLTIWIQNVTFFAKDSPDYPKIFITLCLFCILCYVPLIIGFHDLDRQERRIQELNAQKILIQQQIDNFQELELEYRNMRRWNHDIANHMLAIQYLLEKESYAELDTYLAALLISDNCRNSAPLHTE